MNILIFYLLASLITCGILLYVTKRDESVVTYGDAVHAFTISFIPIINIIVFVASVGALIKFDERWFELKYKKLF